MSEQHAAAQWAATRWPWRITATYKDGSIRTNSYSEEFEPLGFARRLSQNPDIIRVDVAVAFAGGEAVAAP